MFQFLAGILAFFYSLIPNYAIAIGLLTFMVMLLLSPLTLKSTRSMLAMQKIQPEMKRLQQQHKGDRQALNEAVMALYKAHGVNPVAGCLPMLLQMPVFLIMYRVIRGLTHTVDGSFAPKYIDKTTELYKALHASGGRMKAFGIDLARSATEGHGSFGAALPFFVLVALVVATQYWQTRQTTARNSSTPASSQQQILLKVMPAFFGLISLSIQAALNVYFLVSALFRIGQTAAMYRFDSGLAAHVRSHTKQLEAKLEEDKPRSRPAKPKGTGGKITPPPPRQANGRASNSKASNAKPSSSNGGRPASKRRSKKGR